MTLRLFCVGLLLATVALAQPPRSPKAVSGRTAEKTDARNAGLTNEQRALAIAFVEEHHPELATLLAPLRTRNEREFDRALRQIHGVADRLAKSADRYPERSQMQLEAWKLDSRIKLLAARLSMGEDESLERDLRKLVTERFELRTRQYEYERDQLAERLANVNAQIERAEADPESAIDRELKRIHAGLRKPKTVETKAKDVKKVN